MLTLAREYGNSPVSAERLSEADSVPSDYVSQILMKLRRAGIVSSHRGSAGGYALSRPPAEITLGQVVRAVDRDVFEDVCGKYDAGAKDCRHQEDCSISPVWRRLGSVINEYLESVTLASLLNSAPGACGAEPAWLAKVLKS
jgi:Rrf2 family protein